MQLNKNSPEVQEYLKKYPDVTEESAIGSVLNMQENQKRANLMKPITTEQPVSAVPTQNNLSTQPQQQPIQPIQNIGQAVLPVSQEPIKPLTYDELRQQERSKIQATIDAINEQYNIELGRLRQQGQEQINRGLSIQASRGAAGTPFAERTRSDIEKQNIQIEKAAEAEKNAKIAAAEDRANEQAFKVAQLETQRYQMERGEYLEKIKQTKAESFDILKGMAGSGVEYDKIPETTKSKLLQSTGLDDFSFRAIYNSNLPESQKEDVKYEVINNRIVGYKFNPTTRKLETYSSEPIGVDVASGVQYDTKITDGGQMILTPKNFDPTKPIKDQIIVYGKEGEFGEDKTTQATTEIKEYEYAKNQGYSGTFIEWKNEKKQEDLIGGYTDKQNKIIASVNDKISKNNTYQKMNNLLIGTTNVLAALSNQTGTGDLAAINQFQKVIDDGAVTRDQDVVLITERAQSIVNRAKSWFASKKEGEILSPNARKEMDETIKTLYDAQLKAMNKDPFINSQKREIERNEIKPEDTILGFLGGFNKEKEQEQGQLVVPKLNQPYKDINSLIKAQPETKDFILKYSEQYPNDTDEEMLQFMESNQSFNEDLNKSVKGLDIKKVADAIGQYESGNNYQIRGKTVTSGQYKGERALGKYQIMPGNLPSWSKQALGRVVSETEFLNNPEIQDQIAFYHMNKIAKNHPSVEDIASIWFSGQPANKAGNKKDVIGTTVPQYIKNIKAIYNKMS